MRALAAILLLAVGACQPPSRLPTPPVSAEQPAPPAQAVDIQVTAPLPNAAVRSPLRVTGTAPGTWYFEAIFDARLIGADGRQIAQAPAQAQSDWMTTDPVPFVAEFAFSVEAPENATIVLTEDQTGEEPTLRAIRIPVVLLP